MRLPDQNKNLKEAWAASGHANIFGSGTPFCDDNTPGKKKVVPSDTNPNKHICLAMAL